MIRRLLALILMLLLLLCGCTNGAQETQPPELKDTVGISLPDFSWNAYATQLNQLLKASGHQVIVEYADGDAHTQESQVQTFVSMPVSCMILVAVDSMALGDALAHAKQEGVPVIALDRMLMHTDGVTGCVAVDYYGAGEQIGRYIIEKKQLETATEPVTIEFFMGSPENHSALLFYEGVMQQLKPYLENGTLKCLSKRTAFEDVCFPQEDLDAAWSRCFDYLTGYYKKDAPDVVCAATDTLAAGCIKALNGAGIKPESDTWPLITGAGATEEGLENTAMGYQSVTLRADMQTLVTQCVLWTHSVIKGKELTGDTTFNGAADVPTYLLLPTVLN